MSEPDEGVTDDKNYTSYGKCWAAIRNDLVVMSIPMRVPKDIDFDQFRQRATSCLEMLGEVKSGELIEREGQKYFLQRLTHINRGKAPRKPKEYLVFQPNRTSSSEVV